MTGFFHPFFFCTILIFLHECGHFATALLLGWKTDKIYFYPYGGSSSFEEDLNCPIYQEFLVLLMGPLIQCLVYFVLKIVIAPSFFPYLEQCHYALLCFNLLPIYPLDGGKFLYLLNCKLFAYKKGLNLTFFFSYLVVIAVFFYLLAVHYSFVFLLIALLLFSKLFLESRKRDYYYQKFLLERYLNHYPFRKWRKIDRLVEMKKGYRHLLKGRERYYTEREFLKEQYHNRRHL